MIDNVNSDIVAAQKRGDKKSADAIKMLKNSLANAIIAKGDRLDQQEEFKIVRKEIKSRIEARDLYAKNQRQELAAKEEFERNLFSSYVPSGLSQPQILDIIKDVAKEPGIGLVFSMLMPAVMKQVAGRADGKLVSELVSKYIGEQK